MGGYDHMIVDDVLLEDDEGHQGIVALFVDPRKANRGGVYAAFRTHEHADENDGNRCCGCPHSS